MKGRMVSSVLLKTGLEIAALDTCNQTYVDSPAIRGLPTYIQPSQICAVDPEGKNDTCQGDSGGPLQKIVKDHHHIVGITSFGILCGSTTPSIYTRVSFYLDWIEGIVWP
jgi:secreted trypsin-like serine protease